MDKGLKILIELKKELEQLKLNYNVVIEEKDSAFNDLMSSKGRKKQLELKLHDLTDKKEILESAPKKLRKYKKKIINVYFFGFLFFLLAFSALLTFISVRQNLGALYVFKNGIQLLLGGSLVSTIMGAVDYSNAKRKYNVGDLSQINQEINDIINSIEFYKNKIEVSEKKFNQLKGEQLTLDNSINMILDKINSIGTIRNEIIESYCKDNKELDNLLDIAYEEKIEGKQKQKTKNGNE